MRRENKHDVSRNFIGFLTLKIQGESENKMLQWIVINIFSKNLVTWIMGFLVITKVFFKPPVCMYTKKTVLIVHYITST